MSSTTPSRRALSTCGTNAGGGLIVSPGYNWGSPAKQGQTKGQKSLSAAKTHHGINENNAKNKNEHLFNSSCTAIFFMSLENNGAFTHSAPPTEYLPVTGSGSRLCLRWRGGGPGSPPRQFRTYPEGSRDSWGSSTQGDCTRLNCRPGTAPWPPPRLCYTLKKGLCFP